MPYEIDFIGLDKETKDATAICMRWKNWDGSYTVGVFDGGFTEYGEQLKKIMDQYYFGGFEGGHIDFVICSHPHKDHVLGLKTILENFDVDALYMNRPWQHIDALYERVKDGRITPKSLEERLKEKYSDIADLEDTANEQGIPIYDVFEGDVIEGRLTVLSPSVDFYLDLLAESRKTPVMESAAQDGILHSLRMLAEKAINFIKETWDKDSLKENVTTEPDNETSTVILGDMEEEYFLLTGDVGIRGLRCAIDYADSIGSNIQENVTFYEVPHHGGRSNVSPSILDELLGEIVEEGTTTSKIAFTCTGKGTDHPRQMVVNAFVRRGVKVYTTEGQTIHHKRGDMPDREGWTSLTSLGFQEDVEDWN